METKDGINPQNRPEIKKSSAPLTPHLDAVLMGMMLLALVVWWLS